MSARYPRLKLCTPSPTPLTRSSRLRWVLPDISCTADTMERQALTNDVAAQDLICVLLHDLQVVSTESVPDPPRHTNFTKPLNHCQHSLVAEADLLGILVRLRPRIRRERVLPNLILDTRHLQLFLVLPHPSDFGMCINDRGDGIVIDMSMAALDDLHGRDGCTLRQYCFNV